MQISVRNLFHAHKVRPFCHLFNCLRLLRCVHFTKQVSGHEFTHAVLCHEDTISLRRGPERSVAERQQKASAAGAVSQFAFFVRYDRSTADCYNLFPFHGKEISRSSGKNLQVRYFPAIGQ